MIPYYLTGILMYVNPTIQFLMGRFYFHEPLEIHRLIAFCFIWVGVGFTIWHNSKRNEKIERSRKHHIYKCRTGRRGKYFPAGSVFIYFDRVGKGVCLVYLLCFFHASSMRFNAASSTWVGQARLIRSKHSPGSPNT